MPEEKTTLEQVLANAAYHNRGETIRQLAYANFIERKLPFPVADLINLNMNAVFSGPIPYAPGKTFDALFIVGRDLNVPGPLVLQSRGGEIWGPVGVGGGFTGTFKNGRINEAGVIIIVGTAAEIQKFVGPFVQKHTGGVPALNAVAFGNDVWLACGDLGEILKSIDDGETWVNKNYGGPGNNYRGIEYHNGRFVMVTGDHYYYSNDDGESWLGGIFTGEFPVSITGLCHDGTQFIAWGEAKVSGQSYKYPVLFLSTNGSNWVKKFITVAEYEGQLWEDFGDEIVGVSYDRISNIYALTMRGAFTLFSYDNMETWSIRDAVLQCEDYSICHASGAFFIIGTRYGEGRLFRCQFLF